MFRLADFWVWDSWIVRDRGTYHLFFLKAPRSLIDPNERHTRAVIGHASSIDLVNWIEHEDALHPSRDGWDNLTLWTGSVVRGNDGVWRMFYTGLGKNNSGILDQRIGVAESEDLFTWHRRTLGPVVVADPRWYRTIPTEGALPVSETWRDPFVFRDDRGDGWHMLVTARVRDGHANADGVVGHAWSPDLVTWTVFPPVSEPGPFGQLEVMQVQQIAGRCVMVFTCHPDEQEAHWRRRFPSFCTWSMTADSALGPWDLGSARPFEREPYLFAAPLVQDPRGDWVLIGFRNVERQGTVELEIVDPIPVRIEDGVLVG